MLSFFCPTVSLFGPRHHFKPFLKKFVCGPFLGSVHKRAGGHTPWIAMPLHCYDTCGANEFESIHTLSLHIWFCLYLFIHGVLHVVTLMFRYDIIDLIFQLVSFICLPRLINHNCPKKGRGTGWPLPASWRHKVANHWEIYTWEYMYQAKVVWVLQCVSKMEKCKKRYILNS